MSEDKEKKPIDMKMLVFGFLTGVLVMVPMIVVFVWLYLKFGIH
jgi:hypothetical protein